MAKNISCRVREAAQIVLRRDKSIGPLELLTQMGFVHDSHIQQWQKGSPHYPSLSPHIQCGNKKLNQTYTAFFAWVKELNLEPFQAEYSCASRSGSQPLKISESDRPEDEQFFRTHFRRSDLTEEQKQRIETKQNKVPDLIAYILVGDSVNCVDCGVKISRNDIFLLEKQAPVCLSCADMAHLEFLPRGDATLTRRARKHSQLSAIVMLFNRRRKRYERQGILASTAAIDAAHSQNENDADKRAELRAKSALRRIDQDHELVANMSHLIVAEFPGCPSDEAKRIAAHTAVRGSGRVGRSAAGRNLEPAAISRAVGAWVRHQHTNYDQLLMEGVERQIARTQIRDRQNEVLARWQNRG